MIYGYPKLTAPRRIAQILNRMGVPSLATYLTAILQFFGGLFLIIGFIVRIVALLFAISMVADTTLKITKMKASYIREGSPVETVVSITYENDILYLLLSIVMLILGAGVLSLDYLIGL